MKGCPFNNFKGCAAEKCLFFIKEENKGCLCAIMAIYLELTANNALHSLLATELIPAKDALSPVLLLRLSEHMLSTLQNLQDLLDRKDIDPNLKLILLNKKNEIQKYIQSLAGDKS